jgi:hypothetical protein
LVCGLFAQAAEPECAVVENAYLRMVFSSTPAPALRELTQKTSGMNLLASAAAPLFALQVAQTNGVSSWVESQQAKQGSVAISPVTGGKRILLAFEGLNGAGPISTSIAPVPRHARRSTAASRCPSSIRWNWHRWRPPLLCSGRLSD